MDFRDSPEEAAFRQRLRDWLRRTTVPASSPTPTTRTHVAFQGEWHKKLYAGGWLGLTWPRARRPGPRPVYEGIFNEELRRRRAAGAGTSGTWPRRSWASAARSSRLASCPPCSRARRGGARASASPAPAPTWRRCAPGRPRRRPLHRERAEGLDDVRQVGRLVPRCWPAPTGAGTRASRHSSCGWTRPASRCGPCNTINDNIRARRGVLRRRRVPADHWSAAGRRLEVAMTHVRHERGRRRSATIARYRKTAEPALAEGARTCRRPPVDDEQRREAGPGPSSSRTCCSTWSAGGCPIVSTDSGTVWRARSTSC